MTTDPNPPALRPAQDGPAPEPVGPEPTAAVASGGRSSIRRFAKLWGFALFALGVVYWFRGVLLPFVIAILIAYVLAPAVDRISSWRIRGHRLPRSLAVVSCYIVLISSLAVFFVGFMPRLSRDFSRLGREAPKLWERVDKEWTPRVAGWLERRFPSLTAPEPAPLSAPELPVPLLGPIEGVPRPPGTVLTFTPLADGDYAVALPPEGLELERLQDGRVVVRPHETKGRIKLEEILRGKLRRAIAGLEGQASNLIRFTQSLVVGLLSAIMTMVLVLMVAAFILIDIERVHAGVRSLVPARYRSEYEVIVAGIDRGLNGVIRGQLLVCLVNGVLTYIGLLIFQVNYSLLLAVLAGIMSLIPIFGSILSSFPIVTIAMVSGDQGFDLLNGTFILLWILGIHFIEANILNPKILGKAAKIHPVIIIFALIAGEKTYGIVGALLAVPTASIVLTIFNYFRSRTWRLDPAGGSSSVVGR